MADKSGINAGIEQSVISKESIQGLNQNIKKLDYIIEDKYVQ